jgi:hypothetical protein
MIERTAKCDVCKTSISLGAGYALHGMISGQGSTFKIKPGIGEYETATAHVCGKECLIKKLSEEIDRMSSKSAETVETDTNTRHGNLPLIRLEGGKNAHVSGH